MKTLAQTAFVPRLMGVRAQQWLPNLGVVLFGTVLLSALAQIQIPLPFTVVPITGQTFGVIFLGMLYGAKRAGATVGTYLLAGFAGLPIFAGGAAGLGGPTMGYLFGMILAGMWVGKCSDWGLTGKFWSAYLCGLSGSLWIFGFGALGLSAFIPWSDVFAAGVLPFIPGDLIKTALAAGAVVSLQKKA